MKKLFAPRFLLLVAAVAGLSGCKWSATLDLPTSAGRVAVTADEERVAVRLVAPEGFAK